MIKLLNFTSGLVKLTVSRPRDLKHVFGIANWALGEISDPQADIRSIPSVDFRNIPCGGGRFSFQTFPDVGASITLQEAAALVALCRSVNAKRVFEFGTYKGVSTTQFALNLPENGIVFTLDLPEDHPAYFLDIPKFEEQQIAAETGKGILVPDAVRHRVTFLRSDSATFDTTPYRGTIDLVFVDGAHSYEYVKNDSEKGLEMLKPGGIIAWHDCVPSHRDVVRYLKSLGNPKLKLLSGTTLAYLTV